MGTFVDWDRAWDDVENTDDLVINCKSHLNGDIGLIFVSVRRTSQLWAMSEPTGWSKEICIRESVDTSQQFCLFSKELNGTTDIGNHTINYDAGPGGSKAAALLIFRGYESPGAIIEAITASPLSGAQVINGQTEADYAVFAGGSGFVAGDVGKTIYVDKVASSRESYGMRVVVTVDAVSAGAVTEFTVDSTGDTGRHDAGDVLAQVTGGTAGGTGFSMTGQSGNFSTYQFGDSTPSPPDITTLSNNGALLSVHIAGGATGVSAMGQPPTPSGMSTADISTPEIYSKSSGKMMFSYKEDYGTAGLIDYTDGTDDWTHTLVTGRIINNQDETSYDNSPTTEGTFSGGSGFTNSPGSDDGETITLADGTVVTIDNVSGGAVDQFTVGSNHSTGGHVATDTISQTSTTAPSAGTGFSLTVDTGNLADDSTANGGMTLSIALKPAAPSGVILTDVIVVTDGSPIQ